MFCCGSGSDFGKGLVPALVPVQAPVLVPDPYRTVLNIAQLINQQPKFVQNLAISMTEAALFPKKMAFHF